MPLRLSARIRMQTVTINPLVLAVLDASITQQCYLCQDILLHLEAKELIGRSHGFAPNTSHWAELTEINYYWPLTGVIPCPPVAIQLSRVLERVLQIYFLQQFNPLWDPLKGSESFLKIFWSVSKPVNQTWAHLLFSSSTSPRHSKWGRFHFGLHPC